MLRVYFVDDEQPIIDELLKIIDWHALGYEVCGYSNTAEEALQALEEIKPHLLICDINMGAMSGLALTEEIANRKLDTEVILLTAHDLFDYAVQAIKLKVRSYLVKPVNRKELTLLLQNFRNEKCQKLFGEFFTMLTNGGANEKLIERTEKESVALGFVKSDKNYIFAFTEMSESFEYIRAEYQAEHGKYLLIEVSDENLKESLPFLYSEPFKGGENYFKHAKEIVALSKWYGEDNEEAQKEINSVIQNIMKDIEGEYAQKISLGYYAERYHYNLSYLSKQFKMISGMNFVDWLLEFRLNKAKQLMKDGNLTLNDIAMKVGYIDYSHFCKAFKRSVGMSPQEYRTNYC